MAKHRVTQKDLRTVAKKLLSDCVKHPSEWAVVVALSGDLGAGKTTLTKQVAQELGIKGEVTSPTFVIEKIYGLSPKQKSRFTRLIHIDAYRLEKSADLDVLGWHYLVNDPCNLILVEWPEHVKEALPNNVVWVHLKHVDKTLREISW